MNLETLTILLKWTAQALIVIVGVWGLFSDPYQTDPATGKRKLNQSGWVKMVLLSVGFALFAITDMHERQESVAARERQSQQLLMQKQTISSQETNLGYLRELLLSQHQLSEFEIVLRFPEERMRAFVDRIHQFDVNHPNATDLDATLLAYIASSCRGSATARYAGLDEGYIEYALNRPQGFIAGRVDDQAPGWRAFTTSLSALLGDRFEVQSETGRILIDLISPERPLMIRFEENAIIFTHKGSGIRLDEIRGTVNFVCGKKKPLYRVTPSFEEDEEEDREAHPMSFGPTEIELRSRDPRVVWNQQIDCEWRPEVTWKFFYVETDETAELGEWRSEGHLIEATLSDLSPR